MSRWAAGRIFDGSSSSGAVQPFGRILGCTTRCLEGRWPAPGELARPSSDAVLASPEVTVSSPRFTARSGTRLPRGASDP